jgi:phage-related protein
VKVARFHPTARDALRAFYVVKVADAVVIFHAFAKKTQKTPVREMELGKKRLKEML